MRVLAAIVLIAAVASGAEPTRVTRVYPTAGILPANLLKLYIEFSAPMSRGDSWQHVSLLREDGSKVDLPFLELEQELWDPRQQRFTILFDPGRIKRGVRPLVESGPSIEEGKSYTFVVSRSWRDANNQPLAEDFRKTFRVGPDDRQLIDPSTWKLTAPQSGSRDALVIDAGEPLDSAIFPRAIAVPGVDGSVELGREEREWKFTPSAPWKPGDYKLAIDVWLEDLAGNRVGRAFDVDVFDRVTKRPDRKTVELPFRIR
jgi:hypothetical protein